MLKPRTSPRRAQILLWASATLFTIFAGLSVAIWLADRKAELIDPKLYPENANAELSSNSSRDPQTYLGIRYSPVKEKGVAILEVTAGGPAEKAGMKAGDVLVMINGEAVKDSEGLRKPIFSKGPGQPIDIQVKRDGKEKTFKVSAGEQGWPQWRGVGRDGVASVNNLLTEWPAGGPPILWHDVLPGITEEEAFSSFAVRDSRAYSLIRNGHDEIVVCWDMRTGKRIWEERYDCGLKPRTTMVGYSSGPRSTPTIDGDRLYTVGTKGILQCRNTANGNLLWDHHLLREYHADNLRWGTAFSPLVDGNLVFTNPGGPNGKSIVAFDKFTGAEVWASQDDAAGYSSPIAITVEGDRQIVFFTANHVLGVAAATGVLRWSYPWATSNEVNAATPIAYQVTIDGKTRQRVFISSGYNKGSALLAIEPRDDQTFEAKPVWTQRRMRSHFGSPVRVDDHIYGFDETDLICLSLRTGKVVWKQDGFFKGSLVVVNDKLLVLSETGTLALMKVDTEEYPGTLASAEVLNSNCKCWTMPVVAEGKVLLRDKDKVVCLDLTAK